MSNELSEIHLNSGTYQTCATLLCNNEEIKKETCIVCNSESESDCKHDPSSEMAKQCPLSITPQGCLMFQNRTYFTRDCMSADEELREICLQEGDTCKYCFGDECNKKPYFTSCHICSSSSSQNCVDKPWLTPIQTCKKYIDECYIHIDDKSVVTRGCFSEFPSDEFDCSDEGSCQRCTGDNACNDAKIEYESCVACSNSNPFCKDSFSSTMIEKCRLSMQLNGCYHFEDNDEIKRGCISEIEEEDFRKSCESNSDKCKKCDGNGCNSRTTGFQTCLTDEHSIVKAKANFVPKTCTNYMDECFTHVTNDSVRKGCLGDAIEIEGINIMSDCENPDICEKCSGHINCNNQTIQREFCIVCDSNTNPDCKNSPKNAMRDQCPLSVRPMGCLTLQNDTAIKRACMSAYPVLREQCLADDENCKYCFGELCNKTPYSIQCHICDSTKDKNCITNPELVGMESCKNNFDECFTHVSNDSVVTRGCLAQFKSDKENCSNEDTCQRCSEEDGCNKIPIKTESCYSCDSKLDPRCKSKVIEANKQNCPVKTFQPLGCYHYISETQGHTKRGCITSLSSGDRKLALKQTNEWKNCKDRDNCNSKSAFASCFKCHSTSDPGCMSGQFNGSIKICNSYEDDCFSLLGLDSAERGCLSDLKQQTIEKYRLNPKKFKICTNKFYQICNSDKINEAKCITCDLRKNLQCKNEPEQVSQKYCGSIDLPDEDLGCYLDKRDGFKRGCVSDLTVQDRQICSESSSKCKICKGYNCNKKVNLQYCYTCTSRDQRSCTKINPPYSYIPLSMCPNYMDKCLVAIDLDGYTVRQCIQNDNFNVSAYQTHEKCEDNACNGKIFPEERLECYQCDGDRSCNRLKTDLDIPLEVKPCGIYDKNDQCFMYMNEGMIFIFNG